MKKTLLALALGAVLCPQVVQAQSESSFSYATEPYATVGTNKKDKYDVAVFLPGEAFKGMKITNVSVPLVKTNDADKFDTDTVYVWLSKELKLVDKLNAPDIAKYEVVREGNPTEINFNLPESYDIPAEGVYVGYSFSYDFFTDGSKSPLAIGMGSTDPNGLYLHTTKTYLKWQDYSSKMGGCSCLKVKMQGSIPEVGVTPLSCPEQIYAGINEPSSFLCQFVTTATEDVESIDVEYEVNGKTDTIHCDMVAPIEAGINKGFEAMIELPAFDEKFSSKITFKVIKVNGKPNTVDSTIISNLTILTFHPKHLALLEEYTGLGCGYCPRGFASLEYIKANYPEYVTVAYHSRSYKDPMDCMWNTNSGNAIFPSTVPGFPYAWLDRTVAGDPYYFPKTNSYTMADAMTEAQMEFTPWEIKVSQEWEDDNTLTANVQVRCLNTIENGDYKLGYILVQNGMSNSGWLQSNYYSGDNPDNYIEEMKRFCKAGQYVAGLVFNDVVISCDGTYGIENSIPTDLAAEEPVTGSFSFRMEDVVSYQGLSLVGDKDDIYVVAFVMDGNGKVLNCAKTKTEREAGVKGIVDDSNAPVEFYNLNGVKVSNPTEGVFICRKGSKVSKIMVR